jgi:ankyrin repeat protein/serine/threonine protein kinase
MRDFNGDDRKPPARKLASLKRPDDHQTSSDLTSSVLVDHEDSRKTNNNNHHLLTPQIRSESALPLYRERYDAMHHSSDATLLLAPSAAAAIGLPQQPRPVRRRSQQKRVDANTIPKSNYERNKDHCHGTPHSVNTGNAPLSIYSMVEFEPKGWQREKNWNELHVALSNKAEGWKIKQLLETNPGMEMERNSDGNTPLHEGLKSQADVTDLIHFGSSAVISTVNQEGELPLHIACERGAPLYIMSELVSAYPQAVKAQTNLYFQTPLHYLMNSKSASLSKIKLLLEACPEASKIQDKYGRTAFLLGVEHGAPQDVLEALYHAFPEAAGLKPIVDVSSLEPGRSAVEFSATALPEELAAKFQNGKRRGELLDEQLKGYIPHGFRQRHEFNILHVALSKGAPVELIRMVLEINPKMAEGKTTEGNCPFMEGLIAGAKEEALHAVLDASEKVSCTCNNNNNEYALHMAAPKASLSLVRRIVLANPEASMAQSLNEDEMPLHRLMASQYSDELVELVLSKFRKAACVRDRFGRTPLHAAVNNRAPSNTILAVVKAFPEALGIEDNHKRTPLDDATFLDYLPLEMLKLSYEEACKERDFVVNDILQKYKPVSSHVNQGWNSLHVALSKGASSQEIDILLESSPNMARKQNEMGNFPLNVGLLEVAINQILADVLIAHPDACKSPNNNGDYALHHSAYSSSPMIIEMILSIYPDAINIPNTSFGKMPLHVLVGQKSRDVGIDAIRRLVTETSIKARDKDGNTPLHIAIKNNLHQTEIEYLLLEYTEGAAIADRDGHLPLHNAIRNLLPEDLLITLLRAHPNAVRMKYGEEGFLPLHMAMKYCSGSSFTAALIEQNERVASIQTRNGFTPLSLALMYGADYGSLFSVLKLFEGALKVKDSENMVPLHVAMMRGAPTEVVATLIYAGPDAIKYRNNQGHTPFHSGIIPAVHVLQQRHPTCFQLQQMRNTSLPYRSSSQSNLNRGRSPLVDLLTVLNNLEEILSYFPAAAEQKDASGNLPLLQYCMTFNPSVIHLNDEEQEEAAKAVTRTLEKIFRAYPPAAEITGPFVGTPISVLVGECSMAPSVRLLLAHESPKRLSILLQCARDGRSLQPLCTLENKVSLYSFFVLFNEDGNLSNRMRHESLVLDLNREVIKGWSILDILADFDTPSSAEVLLQILREQKTKMDLANEMFYIKNRDGETLIEFRSIHPVLEGVRTRIADRAKLVNNSLDLRLWGQAYGRFLKTYRLEKQPKHVSETCVVVFGTEAIKEDDGRLVEHPVALKFMCSRHTFLREVKKRPQNDKGTASKYVFPIRATYSSRRIDEFECKKVNLRVELEPYKETIKLEGSDLNYVIVMDCGAGYDLHDFISHQNVAGKDLLTVMAIAKEIALCLKFLNEVCGIIHGDVKARNFVAKGVGFIGFAAIDLDNASTIGRESAGLKQTSSGYLPPEQAAVEAFERSGEKASHDPKPPNVIASCQYDMWCFGVLLYFLFTGKQLFNVDTKEDVDYEDLLRICTWENSWKDEKLSKVNSKWPIKLLDSLLQKNPSSRPKSWGSVVDELNKVTVYSDSVLYDKIVVFQSDPLVFVERNGDIRPMIQLDFVQESDMLKGALEDAGMVGCTIDVLFETGSLDRLQAFMAQQMTRVMHFSGHGTLKYMAWEDERGMLKRVYENDLRRQIEGIGSFLRLVFISTCHSQWVAQAFIDAGVRHAVCCPVDKCLLDIAASEFTRNFYRGLACKMTVKQAFKSARTAVAISPHVRNREAEAEKFLLLPDMPDDSDYHDVPVFFTSETRPVQNGTVGTQTIGVPRYRQLLVGRNDVKYSILSGLSPDSSADVVAVWGRDGMGKTAVVADVCNHIRLRPRSPPQLGYLFWFPPTGQVVDNKLYQVFASLLDLTIQELEEKQSNAGRLRQLRQEVADMVLQRAILIVVDVRAYQSTVQKDISRMFREAVAHLLEISLPKYLKVIFIENEPPSHASQGIVTEESVPVMELYVDAAVTLFAHCVPEDLRRKYSILNSRTGLIDQLLEGPKELEINQETLNRREDEVWNRYLGSGKPSRICDIARSISEQEVQELLRNWWDQPDAWTL